MSWSAFVVVPGSVPVDVGRDQAAAAAQAELAKPAYARATVRRWWSRSRGGIDDLLGRVISAVGSVGPGGIVGLVVLAALVVLIVVLVRWRVGPLRRPTADDRSVFVGPGPLGR